jgi:hypothetical protein
VRQRVSSTKDGGEAAVGPTAGGKRKEPPGNRAALPLGRIVPTEAKPSELSGCIVGSGSTSVKNNSEEFKSITFNYLQLMLVFPLQPDLRIIFAFFIPVFLGFSGGFLLFRTCFPQACFPS